MAGADHEKVMFAREVFNLFVKAYTNLKLYPHHHVHCTSAVEEFSNRLRSYVSLHNVLRITVNQETLGIGDDAVYENPEQKENLAFRLYVDGLREISISNGVTAEEAEKLCMVFYQAIVDPDADSTLLLWEADFTNVDYAAINQLSEAWDAPDYFSNEQLDLLKQMNANVDRIVEQLTANADRGAYAFELTDGARELESIEDLDEVEEREEDDDIFQVDEEALARFQRQVLVWGPDRMLRVYVDHMLDGYAVEPQIITRDMIEWLLTEAASMSLRSQDMDLLGDILARYEEEVPALERDEDRALFARVFEWLGREENIVRMVQLATSGKGVGGPVAFCKILAAMGPTGVTTGVATYLEAKDNVELREALTAFLQANLYKAPLALLPMLDPSLDAETVKAGMFVINKSERRIKGKKLAKLLERCREHADPDIAKYADHLWRTHTKAGQAAQLMDALGAEKRADRVKALQTLVRRAYHPAAERLKEVIASPEFPRRDVHERAATIEALRLLGGAAAVPFLEQQTRRRALIFNRKSVAEIREFAAKALSDLKTGG
ncbi:MAG: hypothetical protein D6731_03555 [Planctomycetota bacterium]|nr:MAG: hypothetical protein D6731_03555 [Planctomycetota bacterium]